MTRKDYELIAAAIEEATNNNHRGELGSAHAVVLRLADAFALANPRFDRARFIDACGF